MESSRYLIPRVGPFMSFCHTGDKAMSGHQMSHIINGFFCFWLQAVGSLGSIQFFNLQHILWILNTRCIYIYCLVGCCMIPGPTTNVQNHERNIDTRGPAHRLIHQISKEEHKIWTPDSPDQKLHRRSEHSANPYIYIDGPTYVQKVGGHSKGLPVWSAKMPSLMFQSWHARSNHSISWNQNHKHSSKCNQWCQGISTSSSYIQFNYFQSLSQPDG